MNTVQLAQKPVGRAVSNEEKSSPNAARGAEKLQGKLSGPGADSRLETRISSNFIKTNVPPQIRWSILNHGQHGSGSVSFGMSTSAR